MTRIIICGTPGTGKTTIANHLKKYGFKVINLSQFVINNKLYLGYDVIRGSYIIDEEKLSKKLDEILSKEKNLVIEGVGIEAIKNDKIDLCVVLTCDPKVLRKRLEVKKYPKEKILENLEAEILGVVLDTALENYGDKVLVLDSSKLDENSIVEKILDMIRKIEGGK